MLVLLTPIIIREQGRYPLGGVLDTDQPRALKTCEGGRPMYVRVDGYTVFQKDLSLAH
jgi:hypothetical protein